MVVRATASAESFPIVLPIESSARLSYPHSYPHKNSRLGKILEYVLGRRCREDPCLVRVFWMLLEIAGLDYGGHPLRHASRIGAGFQAMMRFYPHRYPHFRLRLRRAEVCNPAVMRRSVFATFGVKGGVRMRRFRRARAPLPAPAHALAMRRIREERHERRRMYRRRCAARSGSKAAKFLALPPK